MTNYNHGIRLAVINQSVKIYIVPLQDSYSEVLPTEEKVEKNSLEKVVELRTGKVWEVP